MNCIQFNKGSCIKCGGESCISPIHKFRTTVKDMARGVVRVLDFQMTTDYAVCHACLKQLFASSEDIHKE